MDGISANAHYDFFIAGRWRNYKAVKEVLDIVRANNKTAYCFIENLYEGEKVEFDPSGDIESTMQKLEAIPMGDEIIRKIFDKDMAAEKASDNFLLVLPAGVSSNIEAGVAYGLGKKCYSVGKLEKSETLYSVFTEIFSDHISLEQWLKKA